MNLLDHSERSRRKFAAGAAADPAEAGDGAPRVSFVDHVWNTLAGLSLLPLVWIFTNALFKSFAHTGSHSVRATFWMSHDFVMFGLGAGAWLVCLCFCFAVWKEPRPLRAYVLGHELMHMLVARLFRGQIKDYHISRDGGYIVTTKHNFLIALAPYLWPFYSVPVLAAWSVSLYWKEAIYYREWFLIALGFTWMFHLTFTLWVLPRGQSDLHGPGPVFSLLLIYLVNTFLLGCALVVLAPNVGLRTYGAEIWTSTKEFYVWSADTFGHLLDFFGRTLRSLAR